MAEETKVRREEGRTWIDGVADVNFGATPNTTMGALAAAAQAAGAKEMTYEYLMSVSGSAFRFQLCKNWCVTSTISHCGYGTEKGAFAALPLEVEQLSCKETETVAALAAKREKGE